MKVIFSIAFSVFVLSANCFSQIELTEFEKGNLTWIKEMKTKPINEQISEIKSHLIQDTATGFNAEKTFISRWSDDRSCRVLLVINDMITQIGYSSAKTLINNLNPNIIKSLVVLDGDQSFTLYGRSCGAIIIAAKNKELWKSSLKKSH